jgi:hypothetical protein
MFDECAHGKSWTSIRAAFESAVVDNERWIRSCATRFRNIQPSSGGATAEKAGLSFYQGCFIFPF